VDSFEDFIRRVVNNLNTAGIDYMFTGALAASYYGTPRTTMDIDIIVNVASEPLTLQLATSLRKAAIPVDEGKIADAVKSSFPIVTLKDKGTPFSLDLILSDEKLEKQRGTILGLPTFYQTPEGLILSKLRMIKATVPKERALKDKDDVKAILRYTAVDMKALRRRAREASTFSLLDELLARNHGDERCAT
jgi:hypothetical protein